VLDDRLQHAVQAADDLLLGLAEGGLVGNLEYAPACIRAFAEEAAHHHAELVHGADDLLHLVRNHQRRQVHHRRGAHRGAKIRRAGREVAERRGERIVEVLLERGVELVDRIPRLLELKA
jgi:hypothetical protein